MHVIEFLGMPRSGKTTQIKMLGKFLRQQKYSVKVITDRIRAMKIQTPPTEVTGFKLIYFSAVVEEYFRKKETCDYLIIDRGFNDSMVWFDVERILRHITPPRAKQIRDTFKEYQPLVNQVFCLMTQPSVSLERHQRTKHQVIDNVGMSEAYLYALKKAYRKNLKNFSNCTVINTKLSPDSMHKAILKKLPLI
jgi:thymidylate kinase